MTTLHPHFGAVPPKFDDIRFNEPNPDASIVMHAGGADEMIRVTRDGFWVRGVRVEQDDREAETVYNAFKQWMAWAALTQR
jgi:hypothetical protein